MKSAPLSVQASLYSKRMGGWCGSGRLWIFTFPQSYNRPRLRLRQTGAILTEPESYYSFIIKISFIQGIMKRYNLWNEISNQEFTNKPPTLQFVLSWTPCELNVVCCIISKVLGGEIKVFVIFSRHMSRLFVMTQAREALIFWHLANKLNCFTQRQRHLETSFDILLCDAFLWCISPSECISGHWNVEVRRGLNSRQMHFSPSL